MTVFKRFLAFSLCLCLMLSFSLVSSVSASSVSIPSGSWLPSNVFTNYDNLTDSQKEIAEFLAGGVGTAYCGWRNYRYNTVYNFTSDVKSAWKSFGSKLFLYTSPSYWQIYLKNNLSSTLGSIINYASSITSSFEAWHDSFSSSDFSIDYSSDLNQDIVDFFNYSDFDDWQFTQRDFVSDYKLDTSFFTPNVANLFYSYPYALGGTNSSYVYFFSSTAKYLFIDTDDYCYYITDGECFNCYSVPLDGNYSIGASNFTFGPFYLYDPSTNSYVYNHSIDLIGVNTYQPFYGIFHSLSDVPQLVSNILNNTFRVGFWRSGSPYIFSVHFCNTNIQVVAGPTFDTAETIYNIDDLNFDDDYVRYSYSNPIVDTVLDLSGLESDLVNTTDIQTSVIDNSFVKSSCASLSLSDISTVELSVTSPQSGITIAPDFFKGLNKYINYLWSFTKPLVSFTSNLLSCFTITDSSGVAIGGLSWAVFGVISVGIISGVVSKFLL